MCIFILLAARGAAHRSNHSRCFTSTQHTENARPEVSGITGCPRQSTKSKILLSDLISVSCFLMKVFCIFCVVETRSKFIMPLEMLSAQFHLIQTWIEYLQDAFISGNAVKYHLFDTRQRYPI